MRCSIDGCNEYSYSRNMCRPHYMKWYHKGGKYADKLKKPNGTGTMDPDGYIKITVEGKQVKEHVLVVEEALGKPVPKGAIIHHLNGKPWDNRPTNLVVCPNQEYHMLLHKRTKELGIIFL